MAVAFGAAQGTPTPMPMRGTAIAIAETPGGSIRTPQIATPRVHPGGVAPEAWATMTESERNAKIREDIESSKYLGGDVEHTHKVKGLDKVLADRVAKEIAERTMKQKELDARRSHMEGDLTFGRQLLANSDFQSNIAHRVCAVLFEKQHKTDSFARGRTSYMFDLESEEGTAPEVVMKTRGEISGSDELYFAGINNIDLVKFIGEVVSDRRKGVYSNPQELRKRQRERERKERERQRKAEEEQTAKLLANKAKKEGKEEKKAAIPLPDEDIFGDAGEYTAMLDESVQHEGEEDVRVDAEKDDIDLFNTDDLGDGLSNATPMPGGHGSSFGTPTPGGFATPGGASAYATPGSYNPGSLFGSDLARERDDDARRERQRESELRRRIKQASDSRREREDERGVRMANATGDFEIDEMEEEEGLKVTIKGSSRKSRSSKGDRDDREKEGGSRRSDRDRGDRDRGDRDRDRDRGRDRDRDHDRDRDRERRRR